MSRSEEPRMSFSVGDCPKESCGFRPSPMYTEEEWRGFVDEGEFPFHCIECDGDYLFRLTKSPRLIYLSQTVLHRSLFLDLGRRDQQPGSFGWRAVIGS